MKWNVFFKRRLTAMTCRAYKALVRLTAVAAVVLTAAGCSGTAERQRMLGLLEQAEEHVEVSPDSTLAILARMDTTNIALRDRALYDLLYEEACFKLYLEVDTSCSKLMSASKLFHQVSDPFHEAVALYYCGVIIYEQGKRTEATLFLKQAEELALQLDNELLLNKIYDSLSMINTHAGLYEDAIHYLKLFIDSSKRLKDDELVARGYNNLSYNYLVKSDADSARLYQDKLLDYVDKVSEENQAIILSSLADACISRGDYAEAKRWLKYGMSIEELPSQWIMLGRMAVKAGDTVMAQECFGHVLKFDDDRYKAKAHQALSDIYSETGDFREALAHVRLADSLRAERNRKAQAVQIVEIQKKYDQAIVKQRLYERTLQVIAVLAVAVLLTLIAIYLYRRTRILHIAVSRNVRLLMDAKERMHLLESSEQSHAEEILALNKQIEYLRDSIAENLAKGKFVYESIRAKRKGETLNTAMEHCLVDYYAYEHSGRYYSITADYKPLTLRLTTYLILLDMGLDEYDIMVLLNVSKTTIRSYRHRLKGMYKTL